jgi:type II secretory pathway pseudopilin PulG
MKLLSKQAGDTIVEVLIAMTVASGVLGSSYTVVNRTMANARQAQEHSEALQIANRQIEYIAALAGTTSAADLIDGNPTYNCINSDGAIVGQTIQNPNGGNYNPACVSTGDVPYSTAFTYDTTYKYFTVYVTWTSVTGRGNDQVSLLYRAYLL